MKCKYCGKEIDEGSVFCGYCGKQQPKVMYCIKCGKEIGSDADDFSTYSDSYYELKTGFTSLFVNKEDVKMYKRRN